MPPSAEVRLCPVCDWPMEPTDPVCAGCAMLAMGLVKCAKDFEVFKEQAQKKICDESRP